MTTVALSDKLGFVTLTPLQVARKRELLAILDERLLTPAEALELSRICAAEASS